MSLQVTSITPRQHDLLMEARSHILHALTNEMDKRPTMATNLNWIDKERWTVVYAANDWALANKFGSITAQDVKHLEMLAVGHVDYASKLALYVAERLLGFRVSE